MLVRSLQFLVVDLLLHCINLVYILIDHFTKANYFNENTYIILITYYIYYIPNSL